MGHGDTVGHRTVADPAKTEAFKYGGKFIRQGKHADGLRQTGSIPFCNY
jgi:hypothetical protein